MIFRVYVYLPEGMWWFIYLQISGLCLKSLIFPNPNGWFNPEVFPKKSMGTHHDPIIVSFMIWMANASFSDPHTQLTHTHSWNPIPPEPHLRLKALLHQTCDDFHHQLQPMGRYGASKKHPNKGKNGKIMKNLQVSSCYLCYLTYL